MDKAIVLSSGGVDSTTCIGEAIDKFGKDNVVTVSCFYGQKHDKELKYAEKIADFYHVKHYTLNLSEIFKNSNCALMQGSTDTIKDESYEEQLEKSNDNIVNTYVPFRNGLFLSAVASFALSLFPEDYCYIYIGAHKGDAGVANYADCSFQFVEAINEAISLGTYGRVHIEAPLVDMTKTEVVKLGTQLKVPYELTWSCYKGEEKACGVCGTCVERLKSFKENGLEDPIEYEVI